ncbi:MAG: methyltransferase domain-containing protein [Chloroflexota bacterium]|nr:MAG: methyltransferase domain-containing protein [Chloroflexota bacterium]
MTEKASSIHQAVQDYYASRARTSTSCCGDSSCDNSMYSPDLLSGLPSDVAGFSLGCGDPITQAGLKPGEIVLDLGSGGGLDCFLASRQVGETGRVIGVDMTPEMLARARSAAQRMGIANVEFRQGYLEELPVENESVDVVISNCVINLSPDKNRVFREVYRTLKPGGRFSVSDIVISGQLPDTLRENMEAWSACVSGAIPAEDYVAGLTAAGFVDVKVQAKGTIDDALALIPAGMPYSALITAAKA